MRELNQYNDVLQRDKNTYYVMSDCMTTENEDSIPVQSILSVQPLQQSDWNVKGWGLPEISNVPFWIIYTSTGALLKKIISYNADEGYIICSSLNVKYENLRINIKDVKALLAVAYITKSALTCHDEVLIMPDPGAYTF